MSDEYAPTPGWPHRQPWKVIRRKTILLDPDTNQPLDPAHATLRQLDRLWAAIHAYEHRHGGTLIGDHARHLRHELVEAEDTARRAQRLAGPTSQEIAA